ncbi:helix-turn-helix domain-containing protein [Acrocarpospora sp. B8E8]|uniref:helix-turn-helix domain-containing protein n=1 Tax=Acrocarpospora sp. B8E8 TaxID=3153572 RepID=UPI00325CEE39
MEYLTTKQAAEILGVDERTVYYYARDHEDFPQPKRFGRTLMWEEQPLREWRVGHPAKQRGADDH